MVISELIQKLEEIKEKHGDIPVTVYYPSPDPDYPANDDYLGIYEGIIDVRDGRVEIN